MRRTIWLSFLAAVVLVAGCKQPETTPPPAPQPAPVAVVEQEQPGKTEPSPPVATEKATAPDAAVTTPPATAVPAETSTVAPTPTPQPAPAVAVPTPRAAKPAVTPASAPPMVTYKATNGNVSFNHQQHAANHPCSSCHPAGTPAKVVLGKDKAHQLCKECHQQQGAGPTQCTGCHKK